ncbi:hypothetical protein [Oceanobacillus oncorhynchi]|uniref:hypothetical protein n=1 Tax=Oceanobacillus oncorhynchi TaxID=545501 RepID=UPI001868B653|nr:hypothetical protein [Oceanobacillus oncorhynchi]
MKSEYNNTEVISMTEKEKLFLLIGRLSSDEVTALSKIVSSMVYSRFPAEDEELTEEEQKELDAAIKAYKKGEFEEGESLDEIFN